MANRAPKPEREYFELGGEPEFFITDTRIEQAGGGNLRLYCYRQQRSELHLVYTTVIPAASLASLARIAMQAASEAHNLAMWEADGQGH